MKGLFKNTLNTIDNEDFINRSKVDASAFTRNRKLSFKDLIVNLMGFTRPSVQTELDRFFKAMSKSSSSFESISKSAFTQSRKKLKPEAFIELAKGQLSYFDQHAPDKRNWKGQRIVAIDGSLLNLPHTDEMRAEFGSVKNQFEEVISARCSFAYDVCNELILDAIIAPRRSSEKDLAVQHLSHLRAGDVLLFDRGYPSQWLMGLLDQQGFKFCFRLNTSWKGACRQMSGAENDIDWAIEGTSTGGSGKIKEYGLADKLAGLRLVSIPLSSGQKELLVTNLTDRNKYSLSDLKALYGMRWGVEEGYKSFKKVLHIEHFSGKTPLAIKQDFYAKVFMLNMTSMIRSQGLNQACSQKNDSRKHIIQPNKTQVIAKTKDFLINLFYNKGLSKTIHQFLILLKKRFEIVRPNRSFPRPKTSTRRRHKIINSKGI